MSVKVGSMFASLSLDTAQFVRGAGKADKTFGTLVTNLRRNADGSVRSLDNMARLFGSAGFGAGSRAFADLSQQARLLPLSVRGVTAAMVGLGGVFGGAALTRAFDSFTNIQNSLRSVGGAAGSTGAQFQTLLGVADRSRSSLEATVTLFARLSKAAPELGFERTAKAVETVSKALALGGATAQEAASAAIQFSQAIGSGVLQGDELRAVLESPLGNALAKGLKLTTAEMRKLGSEGKLTSSVVLKALEDIGPGIDKQFAGSVQTIGQSIAVLENQIVAAVGKFDQSFGASALIGGGITALADNIDKVTVAAEAAAVAIAAITAGRIGGGGVAALGAQFRALATDAGVGVAGATAQLGTLEEALKRALAERAKLNGYVGPMNAKGLDGFNTALGLSNRRIAELTGALPAARTQLVAAQRAASGLGIAMTGIRGVGGSLVGFLGGPWGVAFTAAAAGATLLGARMAQAAQQARDFEEVSSRLLNSVAETNSKAADIVATDKFAADIDALRSDARTAKTELLKVLRPLTQIAAEIDNLRQTAGEFSLFPDAVRTVDFIEKAIDRLASGGSLQDFNESLRLFQERYKVPAGSGLFEEIRDQAAQADRAVQTLSVATDRLQEKQAEGLQLAAVPSPEAATDAASANINRDRLAKIAAQSAIFAGRVDDLKAREVKIAETITGAVAKAGFTLNAGLQRYISALAKTQALADQVTTSGIAAKQPFQIPQNPNRRYPPGRGPDASLEQGNSGIALAKLLEAAAKVRELRAQIDAEKQTISGSGGLLRDLLGDRADSAEVKSELTGIQGEIQRVFDEFSQGRMKPVEAFNAIEQLRQKLLQLGADPGALDAFIEQVGSAISGVPTLRGEIEALTRTMRDLATAANSVKLPGGAKRVVPPNSTALPGYATGGVFKVGGTGGVDSQLVQFMASPSETVAVMTPAQIRSMEQAGNSPGSGAVSINQSIAISTPDVASFKASRRQVQMDLADAVQAAVNRTR